MPIVLKEAEKERLDFSLLSEIILPQTYTLGIYYFYLEGYEGSSDIYAWHDNWDEWCRWMVGYKANLFADYCGGEMPIEFVVKHEVPIEGYDFSSKSVMIGVLKNLEGYHDTDFSVIVTEDNLHSGLRAFPGIHSIIIRGLKEELDVRGLEGEGYNISFIFEHEIAHLFKLDHCSNLPCVMAQPVLSYADWVNQGKELYFCDRHKTQLLENWAERNYY